MGLYDQLFDYQKKIVDNIKDKENYGLFLDMGLGKTVISLALCEVNKCDKVIIITINSKAVEDIINKGSWLEWALKSNMQYVFHSKKHISPFFQNSQDLLILNYESLFVRSNTKKEKITLKDNVKQFIESCKNKNVAIIIDESHKIKNLQSLQTQSIFKLKRELKSTDSKVYTYLLSGTPFTVGYIDLYAQLKLLECPLNKQEFIDNYCIKGNLPGLLGWQQPIIGYKNTDKLYKLIHQYALTIKSEEVISLPEQVFAYIQSKDNKYFNLFLKPIIKGKNNPYFKDIDYPQSRWLADTPGKTWMRARELSSGFQGNDKEYKWFNVDRLNKLEEFLKNNPDNYILFYNYTPELLEIYEICEKLEYNIDVFCGSIKSTYFYDKYSLLNEDLKLNNKHNILISNFASGSTGMNWQNYNKVIFFSLPLYKDYEQSIKRIHRPGQKNTTFYYIFYGDNWLDKSMLQALKEKKQYNLEMFNKNFNLF